MRHERDACGIGFVADASGRPSSDITRTALEALANVKHRGALNADARTADGSGLLTPIPAALFGEGRGVATVFARGDAGAVRAELEEHARAEQLTVAEWRVPPTDDAQLGRQATESQPLILQAVLDRGDLDDVAAERAAYRLRRRLAGGEGPENGAAAAYIASCSFRTIVYKGLVAADLLGAFYLDLRDPRFEVPFAVFHQRFATNTMPTWERAQPFRTLCHNGEINAIAGNVNRMRARARLGTEEAGLGPEGLFRPVVDDRDSDSGMLDAAVEFLTKGGRDIRHAVAMLVPDAWEGARDLDPAVRAFYRYSACLMEPWDGPAGLVFTDGRGVGAALDRNGLRPLRYAVCDDGLVACCSEAGAVDVHGHGKVRRGRLGPGEMLYIDPAAGVLLDQDCKRGLAAAAPYAKWTADGLRRIEAGAPVVASVEGDDLLRRQIAHGYSDEELRLVMKPMAQGAKEPTYSMGDDSPSPTPPAGPGRSPTTSSSASPR